MKIYCLYRTQQGGTYYSMIDLFLTKEQAIEKMKSTYEIMMSMLMFDVSVQISCHHCCFEETKAKIVNGQITFTWAILEYDLDVQAAVEVRGGMVQNVYANADIGAEVYDLDVSDFPDENEQTEADQREKALQTLIDSPAWHKIW